MAGRADVDDFLDELSIDQVRKWRAYFDVIGTEAWRQAGTIAAEIDSLAWAQAGKNVRRTAEDKIPLLRPDDPERQSDGIANLEKALAQATRNT